MQRQTDGPGRSGRPPGAPDSPDSPPAPPPPEPRQRWRITYRRGADAPRLDQRDTQAAWDAAVRSSGLPVVLAGEGGRVRLSFGAPLAAGMPAEAELVDVVLTERLPAWAVREALARSLPEGHELVSVDDVWLGSPALPGQVAAADYRVSLEPTATASAAALEAAAAALLRASALPRERAKGGGTVSYDLRPLLADVTVAEAGPPIVLAIRTAIEPQRGTGRPEEVVAALEAELGLALPVATTVRAGLRLRDELEREAGWPARR